MKPDDMYEKFKEDFENGIIATSYEVFQKTNCEYIKQSYLNAIDVMIEWQQNEIKLWKKEKVFISNEHRPSIIRTYETTIMYLQEQRNIIENHETR